MAALHQISSGFTPIVKSIVWITTPSTSVMVSISFVFENLKSIPPYQCVNKIGNILLYFPSFLFACFSLSVKLTRNQKHQQGFLKEFHFLASLYSKFYPHIVCIFNTVISQGPSIQFYCFIMCNKEFNLLCHHVIMLWFVIPRHTGNISEWVVMIVCFLHIFSTCICVCNHNIRFYLTYRRRWFFLFSTYINIFVSTINTHKGTTWSDGIL